MKNNFSIESVIAANRFGLGVRGNELSKINLAPKTWLLDQLQGPSRMPSVIASLPDSADVLVKIDELRQQRKQSRKNDPEKAADNKNYGKTVRRYYMQQTSARYISAATSDYPFHERLVHFWSNHFAVSADKQPLPGLAGLFEKEAIRANMSGKFSDLLLAAEQHPAMLTYLDNQRSIGPNSTAAQRAGRRRKSDREFGLNENLAREILELHTLGVDGGYSQANVTDFARALTGWSIGSNRGRLKGGTPGKFYFRNEIHQPGSVKVLNKRYSQQGVGQAEAILRDLAGHPATARHIAEKLARHFVADEPPSELVDSLTKTFLESDGDLPSLHAALVNSESAWAQTFGKYKTPEDFVISTFRALNHVPDDNRAVFRALEMMGQQTYSPGSPAGWPDTAAQWGGADGLYKRIEWSNAVAAKIGQRMNPLLLAAAALGPALGDHSRTAISRAESLQQGLVLLLVSPEFQRR